MDKFCIKNKTKFEKVSTGIIKVEKVLDQLLLPFQVDFENIAIIALNGSKKI